MKVEIELNEQQLQMLITSVEIYARSLMSQNSIVADFLAQTVFEYDKKDPENAAKFNEWLENREQCSNYLKMAFDSLFVNKDKKSELCQNLIDMWNVLSHFQYENCVENKQYYDTRSCPPFQGGTEPLMTMKILEENNE